MKKAEYVLDTHALVFALTAPSKLGVRARKAFRGIESGRDCAWIPVAAKLITRDPGIIDAKLVQTVWS